jgi:hypothetical protein
MICFTDHAFLKSIVKRTKIALTIKDVKMDSMMLTRVKLYFIPILLIMAFALDAEEDESPIYTQYVAEVTSTFLKEMYKEYGFTCGASGGSMPYDVESILVQLVANRGATVEQARELEVKATERFVQIINEHEKLKPFLRERPFPPGRSRVTISFRKRNTIATDNDVEFVCHAKNRIYYQAHDPLNPYVGKDIKDEPYEEARKIVLGNKVKENPQN